MSDLIVSSSPAGSMAKEKEMVGEKVPFGEEKFPVVEEKEMEISKEVEPYVEKIEKEIYLVKPVTDKYGQTIVTAPSAQPAQIILPITQSQLLYGLKQSVNDSIRWLAEWCLRLIKIFGQKINFKKGENVSP